MICRMGLLLVNTLQKLQRFVSRFKGDANGNVLIMTAILMPAVLGVAGIGVDAAGWYLEKRETQSIADMAAFAGAHAALEDTRPVEEAALDMALRNNLSLETDQIVINEPPLSGPYAGQDGFVEVIVTRPADVFFAKAIMENPEVNITARAVAGAGETAAGDNGLCVVSLHPTAPWALKFYGGGEFEIDCAIASNSNNYKSIVVWGHATVHVASAATYGGFYSWGGGTFNDGEDPEELSERVVDPYLSLEPPLNDGCDFSGVKARDDAVLEPGRYCGTLEIKGDNVTFEPGVYVIDDGNFKVNGNSSATGEGVTFILTGDNPWSVGTVTINGTADLSIKAPTSGEYEGVLIYQDRKAQEFGGANKIAGTATVKLEGLLYFPQQKLDMMGDATIEPTCVKIYAAEIKFHDDYKLDVSPQTCSHIQTSSNTQTGLQLVE